MIIMLSVPLSSNVLSINLAPVLISMQCSSKKSSDDRKITHVSQKLLEREQDVHIKSQIATCQQIFKYFAPVITTFEHWVIVNGTHAMLSVVVVVHDDNNNKRLN